MPPIISQQNRHKASELFQTARRLHDQGVIDKAIPLYQQLLKLAPQHIPALVRLATIYHLNDQASLAIPLIERAIALDSKNPTLFLNQGNFYSKAKQPRKAITAYRNAMDLGLKQPAVYVGLCEALQKTDDPGAEQECRQALTQFPGNPELLSTLGLILRQKGDIAQAVTWLEKSVEQDPLNGPAWLQLSACKKYHCADHPHIQQVQAAAQPGVIKNQESLISLYFAAGKMLDDCGAYTEAFAAYQKGNALKQACIDFKIDRVTNDGRLVKSAYNQTLLEQAGSFGSDSEQPVFIVGMPRSGTSLLEQILASHSAVHGAGETSYISRVVSDLRQSKGPDFYPHHIAELQHNELRQYAKHCLDGLSQHAPASCQRITDKAVNTFMHVGLIYLLYPKARIIHINRHPLDNCLSCYFQLFAVGSKFSYDLHSLGLYYRNYYELMSHWNKVLPDQIYNLRYEELIGNTEATARALIEFIGLDWEDACMDYPNTQRPVKTLSATQVRQPIYTQSVARWQHYQNFIGPIKQGLGLDILDAFQIQAA